MRQKRMYAFRHSTILFLPGFFMPGANLIHQNTYRARATCFTHSGNGTPMMRL